MNHVIVSDVNNVLGAFAHRGGLGAVSSLEDAVTTRAGNADASALHAVLHAARCGEVEVLIAENIEATTRTKLTSRFGWSRTATDAVLTVLEEARLLSRGLFVTVEQAQQRHTRVLDALPTRATSRIAGREEQVDFEDQMVLAAAVAALDETPAGTPVIVLTNDAGLLEASVIRSLAAAFPGLAVMTPAAYADPARREQFLTGFARLWNVG